MGVHAQGNVIGQPFRSTPAGELTGSLGSGIGGLSAVQAPRRLGQSRGGRVLLDKDLSVLFQGVQEGRKTSANTMKYVFMATDVPKMIIASDSVDREVMESPRGWEVRTIRRFMLMFGTLSSVFDFATFTLLLLVLEAPMARFRTAWFVESVVSAALVVLPFRIRRTGAEVRERRR